MSLESLLSRLEARPEVTPAALPDAAGVTLASPPQADRTAVTSVTLPKEQKQTVVAQLLELASELELTEQDLREIEVQAARDPRKALSYIRIRYDQRNPLREWHLCANCANLRPKMHRDWGERHATKKLACIKSRSIEGTDPLFYGPITDEYRRCNHFEIIVKGD